MRNYIRKNIHDYISCGYMVNYSHMTFGAFLTELIFKGNN